MFPEAKHFKKARWVIPSLFGFYYQKKIRNTQQGEFSVARETGSYQVYDFVIFKDCPYKYE